MRFHSAIVMLVTSLATTPSISIPSQSRVRVDVPCAATSSEQPSSLQSQDSSLTSWSRFRGPNGSGFDADAKPPVEFGPEKNLLWKTELPTGHSSPVILDNHIYLTGEENGKLQTICLDVDGGEVIWKTEAPRSRTETLDHRNNAASPTPAVDESGIVVFFPDFGLLSYSFDGEEQWSLPLGPFNNIYGMGASPIIVGNLVVLVCDQNLNSFLIGVDKRTGEVAWKAPRPEATSGHCTPIVWEPPDGETQVIVPGSFFLTAYSAKTGEKVWWVGGLCFEMKSTPVIAGDMVFINGYGSPANQPGSEVHVPTFEEALEADDKNDDGAIAQDEMTDKMGQSFFPALDLDGDGVLGESEWNYYRAAMASKNSMMAIRLGGAGDMTDDSVVWRYHKNIPQLPSPLVVGDRLYMISDRGIVTVFEAATGRVLHRGRLDESPTNVYSSPVATSDQIYWPTQDGRVIVTKPDETLEQLHNIQLTGGCYATPIFVGNELLIRTEKFLYAFGVEE